MLNKRATPFEILADDTVEQKLLKLKADFLILLTMDYNGGANGVERFALELDITTQQARHILGGQLSELPLDLLFTCLFRKGFDLSRHLVHEGLMNLQLTR